MAACSIEQTLCDFKNVAAVAASDHKSLTYFDHAVTNIHLACYVILISRLGALTWPRTLWNQWTDDPTKLTFLVARGHNKCEFICKVFGSGCHCHWSLLKARAMSLCPFNCKYALLTCSYTPAVGARIRKIIVKLKGLVPGSLISLGFTHELLQ